MLEKALSKKKVEKIVKISVAEDNQECINVAYNPVMHRSFK